MPTRQDQIIETELMGRIEKRIGELEELRMRLQYEISACNGAIGELKALLEEPEEPTE